MGTAFDDNPGWNGMSGCHSCDWLGNDGLSTFSTFNETTSDRIKAKTQESFEDYKARWEYHWNECHRK